jgi:polysaccharide biosynthesis protein PslH
MADNFALSPANRMAEGAHPGTLPFAGRHVVLIHPAWHSCGSHQVFVSQAAAYRALGATLHSFAVADSPGAVAGSRQHRTYMAMTEDLVADRRYYAGMALGRLATAPLLRAAGKWVHGNAAAMLCETTRNVALPNELRALPRIDLIHCNHFFCMPAARALKAGRGIPIILDTHDLQARQISLRNEAGFWLPPKATFEAMLELELAQMRGADLLIHLNDEEAQTMRDLLPEKRHALVYPTIKPVPAGPGGRDLIIVASANYPNFLSVAWFLREVRPLVPDIAVRIIGNIGQRFRMHDPALLKEHGVLFVGRVDDLDSVYANAAAILLPTTSGHGISIKTIEALSSGAPLIAMPEAFRGMAIDPGTLGNVTIVTDAAAFAAALRRFAKAPAAGGDRMTSDTRRLYDRLFAFDAYKSAIVACTAPLLSRAYSDRVEPPDR